MSEPYYGWAVDAVKSLHWLKEIDGCAFEADTNLRGHDPKVVDVAHVRWATSTAITAVDLCVAEIAVKVCDVDFWSKHLPGIKEVRKYLKALSSHGMSSEVGSAIAWLDALESDSDYQLLRRGARNHLTHGFLVRSAMIGPGRTPFELDPRLPSQCRPDPPTVIALAITVAERHVDEFNSLVGPRTAPPPPRQQ
jgi:hypothetical protein